MVIRHRAILNGVVSMVLLSVCAQAAHGAYLLVAGSQSKNVVRIELDSGASSVYGTFTDSPRSLALDEHGSLFASMNTGNQNVVKLVPQSGADVLKAVDFTPSIGGFGPGQIQFHNGDL